MYTMYKSSCVLHTYHYVLFSFLLGITVCYATSWTVWRRKGPHWQPSMKSSGWACSSRGKMHKKEAQVHKEPTIPSAWADTEEAEGTAISGTDSSSDTFRRLNCCKITPLTCCMKCHRSIPLTKPFMATQQTNGLNLSFPLCICPPFISLSLSLLELRQNIGRLLVTFVPALDLGRVNYKLNVIDEIPLWCGVCWSIGAEGQGTKWMKKNHQILDWGTALHL